MPPMVSNEPVTDALVDRMVQAIVDEVDPEQVILFGSRARGDEREPGKRPAAAIGLQSTQVKAVAITVRPYFLPRRQRRNAMLVIHADWDSEAGCWYATSDDIPGLATGADTIEDLIERLKVIVPELVELNEIPVAERVSFELRARRRAVADAAA